MLQTPWQLATGDDFRWAGRAAGDATFFAHQAQQQVFRAYLILL